MSLEARPTVSVVVPNYNHARYLQRRIDSILTQTYLDFELILLDDCSTDHSRDILASYSRQSQSEGRIQREEFRDPVQAVEQRRAHGAWTLHLDRRV